MENNNRLGKLPNDGQEGQGQSSERPESRSKTLEQIRIENTRFLISVPDNSNTSSTTAPETALGRSGAQRQEGAATPQELTEAELRQQQKNHLEETMRKMQDIRERGIELRNKRLELDQLWQTERERRRPELTQPGHGPELELTQLEEIMRRIENIRERGIEQLEKRLELEQVMRKEQEGQQPELRQPEHGPELAQQPTQQRELAQQQPTELERWWKQELQDSRKRRERELELEQPPMELERELEQWWEQAIQDYKKMREREP